MNLIVALKRLLNRQPRKSHRVTTVTRTVTREKGQPEPQQEEVKSVVQEEETAVPSIAMHVSVAVISVASVVVAAFALGWLIRRMR